MHTLFVYSYKKLYYITCIVAFTFALACMVELPMLRVNNTLCSFIVYIT